MRLLLEAKRLLPICHIISERTDISGTVSATQLSLAGRNIFPSVRNCLEAGQIRNWKTAVTREYAELKSGGAVNVFFG